jgi:uncharacterized membrane-anchored protein YitT (DUF2179 family)
LLVTLSDYFLGLQLGKCTVPERRKLYVASSVLINMGMLCYFKYTALIVTTVNKFLSGPIELWDIALPVGISFFTFRSLSYIIDIYRNRLQPTDSFLDYLFFLSFFPPLVAGPVVRATDLLPQIRRRPEVTASMFAEGLFLIICGLFKKVVISDYISINFVDRIFDAPALYTGLENLLGIYGYTLQIYCDFSGYSDMAIGIALLIGFRFPNNFTFGGVTGIAMVLQSYLPFTTATINFVISNALLVIGFVVLGKGFGAKTAYVSILYTFLLSALEVIHPITAPLTDQPLLELCYGIGIPGFASALLFYIGASTGGTDIIAVILNKKFGLSVSTVLYTVDALVLVTQIFFVESAEQVLYGILFVLTYSVLLDVVLTSGKSRIQLQIISSKYEEINRMILMKFDRGSTLYRTEGGFSRVASYAVQTIIGKRELFRMREEVLNIDSSAFIVISQVSEVNGRGFTLEKIAGN